MLALMFATTRTRRIGGERRSDTLGEELIVRMPGLAMGFAPWALFLAMPRLPGDGAFAYAGTIATVVAVALTLWARSRSCATVLEAAAIPTFTVLTLAAVVGTTSMQDWFRVYAPAVTLWALTAVMVASLVTVPFTERHARRSLPESYWRSPHLHTINRRLSLVWSGCTAVAAAGVTAATAVTRGPADESGQYLTLSLAWLLPVVSVLIACRYTEHATNRAGRSST
ncbi:hypothetical protein [Rhodococcus gannanensis]|uniref:Uncharacterized protein n=1 Tax=Rhodococcus gannanensis TaxID=1960308 RepID=A0ABW4P3E7_9NOCA